MPYRAFYRRRAAMRPPCVHSSASSWKCCLQPHLRHLIWANHFANRYVGRPSFLSRPPAFTMSSRRRRYRADLSRSRWAFLQRPLVASDDNGRDFAWRRAHFYGLTNFPDSPTQAASKFANYRAKWISRHRLPSIFPGCFLRYRRIIHCLRLLQWHYLCIDWVCINRPLKYLYILRIIRIIIRYQKASGTAICLITDVIIIRLYASSLLMRAAEWYVIWLCRYKLRHKLCTAT